MTAFTPGSASALSKLDRLDAGVRVRAAQHLAEQHARHGEVGAVGGAAGHLLHAVRPDGALADPLVVGAVAVIAAYFPFKFLSREACQSARRAAVHQGVEVLHLRRHTSYREAVLKQPRACCAELRWFAMAKNARLETPKLGVTAVCIAARRPATPSLAFCICRAGRLQRAKAATLSGRYSRGADAAEMQLLPDCQIPLPSRINGRRSWSGTFPVARLARTSERISPWQE